ncbi:MAG: hypothetical protein H0T46_22100 [Deltaproteobacteria bacterium]|nr:hypothetical protein [Deltaproteobacteria bacterium]
MRMALVVMVGLVLGGSACKKSHDEAVKATREQCVKFLTAADTKATCDTLAGLTRDVAKPFADVSNEKDLSESDDSFLTKCMDSIAENYDRCKDNAAYKKAMDRLMSSVVQ